MVNAVAVELHYGGAWHDITPDVRQADDIAIQWGTADESSKPAPLSLSLTLHNPAGKYSARNPRSPLYGLIGRNTPIRVRLGTPSVSLLLPGVEAAHAVTPDRAALDITGDIDIRADIEPVTWRPPAALGIARKYMTTTGNQRSWAFTLSESGRLGFVWSSNGLFDPANEIYSTAAISASETRRTVRATLDVSNGGNHEVKFWHAPSVAGPWLQLGSTIVLPGTTSVFSSTAPVEVGRTQTPGNAFISDGFDGRMYAFQIRNGISGTVVANADFTTVDVDDTTFVDSAGGTWTVVSPAALVDSSIRAAGEVSAWPPTWDLSGRDVTVPVQASGILRRLGQGQKPLRSSLFRDLSTKAEVVAYWPLEEGKDSRTFASGRLGDSSFLAAEGEVTPASFTGFVASDPLPVVKYGRIGGNLPRFTGATDQRLISLVAIPEDGIEPNGTGDRILMTGRTSGAVSEWQIRINELGSLKVTGKDSDFNTLFDMGYGAFAVNGKLIMLSLWLHQNGGNTDWQIAVIDVATGTATATPGTYATVFKRFTNVRVGAMAGESGMNGAAFGHVALLNGDVQTSLWSTIGSSLKGWAGETAMARIVRLSAEEGVPLRVQGKVQTSQQVGPMRGTFLDILTEAAEADLGTLGDDRDAVRLFYRAGTSLESQQPALTLDYAAGDVAPDLEPVDDDQATRNDVLAKRTDGSSAQAVKETGPLSVADVGRYDTEVELNVATDAQLPGQAAWRLHLGTVDEARFPQITTDLTAAPARTTDACAVFTGDRVQVTNPPLWLPPETIDQLVLGGTELLSPYRHLITYNTTPASPWNVGVLEDDLGRVDTDGSVTASSFVAGTGTALSVTHTAGPRWTNTAAHFPFHITVGGVVLNVTAITGTGNPQTFTVDQVPVNGVTKTIPAGTDVRLAHPIIVGL